MEVVTLLTYRTPDGYRGSIVQVRKKDAIARLREGRIGIREIRSN
jgi:hypothetical protein